MGRDTILLTNMKSVC